MPSGERLSGLAVVGVRSHEKTHPGTATAVEGLSGQGWASQIAIGGDSIQFVKL